MGSRMFRVKYLVSRVPKYLCLGALSITMLFPFYWMIIVSFKTARELSVYPPALLPNSFQLSNYETVLHKTSLLTFFINSTVVAVVETLIMLLITVLAAYGLYSFNFRGKHILFFFILLLNSLPFEVIMMFNYQMMVRLNLINTLIALILPFCSNIFYLYIIYNAFTSIPESIYIAARLDKSSNLKFLWKIALPIVRPTIIFVCIMNAVSAWNSFVWPMLITNSIETRTLPFGIYSYITETGSRNELIMAMTVLSQIPMIIMFVCLRKYLIDGYKSNQN